MQNRKSLKVRFRTVFEFRTFDYSDHRLRHLAATKNKKQKSIQNQTPK